MKTKKMFRRTLTALLSTVMLFATVQGSVFAAGAAAVPESPGESVTASDDATAPGAGVEYSGITEPSDSSVTSSNDSIASDVSPDSAVETELLSDTSLDPSAAFSKMQIIIDLDKFADLVTQDYKEESIRYVDQDKVFVTDYEWAENACEYLYSEAGKGGVLKVCSDNGAEHREYTLENKDGIAQDAYRSAVWIKEDGSELPTGEKPVLPGTYRLKFSLPATETRSSAENSDIVLRIDKTRLSVYSGKDGSENEKPVRTVKAGTPYADLIKANNDFWLSTLRYPKIAKDSESPSPSRDALLDMSKTKIKIGTREQDGSFKPVTDEADTVFRKDRVYVLMFDLVLADDADGLYYVEPEDTVFYVAVGDQTETFMDFEYIDSAVGTGLVKNYDGKEVTPSEILSVVRSSKLYYMDGDDQVVIKDNVAGTIEQDPELTGFWVYSDGVTPLPASTNALSSAIHSDGNARINLKLRDAPTQNPSAAGTYFYKIVFYDETAAFGSSEALIRLVINPVSAVVIPVYDPFEGPEEGETKEINEGTTAGEIIRNVSYRLVDSSGKDITDDIDRKYFWGTAYNSDEGTSEEGNEIHTGQSYEPLFFVQEIKTDEGGNPVVRELAPSDALKTDPDVSYRIVFSGDKALFDADGKITSRSDINSTSLTAGEDSYRIDTGEATRYAKANIVELKVRPANPVAIDVSRIVEGKGASLPVGGLFSKPIESEYDFAPIYTDKKDYRKAIVTAGGEDVGTDVANVKYTWEMFNQDLPDSEIWIGSSKYERRIEAFMDQDGLVFDPPETAPEIPPDSVSDEEWDRYKRMHDAFIVWNDVPDADWFLDGKYTWNEIDGETTYDEELKESYHSFGSTDSHWAGPSNPGIYRLKVTYHDPAHVNKDAAAYVYYVIHKIKAEAVIEGAPVAYGDGVTTAGLILDLLQGRDPASADTYCKVTVRTLSGNVMDGISLYAPGDADGSIPSGDQGDISENEKVLPETIQRRITANPGAYLVVEKKTIADGQTVWVPVDDPYEEVLKASDEYRLRFDPDRIKDEFGKYLNTYYNFQGDRTGTHDQLLKNVSTEDYAGTVPLKVLESQALPVEISVNDHLVLYEKVFDEKGIDLSKLSVNMNDAGNGTKLDIPIRYSIEWIDNDRTYNDPALAVHAGEYSITLISPATAKYRMATQTLGKTYRITKRKIKAIPNLKTPVFAGVDLRGGDYSSVITPNIVESWKMEGLPEGVDDIYKIDGLLEYFALVFRSGNKEELVEDNRYKGLLTSGDEFFVTLDESDYMGANYPVFFKSRLDSFGFNASYGLDYEVRAEKKTFVPVRDHATVTSSDADGSGFEDMQVEASYSHEPGVYEWTDLITAPAGVPVDYDTHGHSMTFNIHKPAEFGQGGRDKSFRSDFAFREDIAKAVKAYGGDPENEGVVTMDDDYITVRLDADLICETDSKKVSFDIIWDVGQNYVEHFTVDLNDTALFADLREAVSPKSFSLVSDRKKMAVGDTMQLDARIKKNQNSDLILLAYESDKPEVLNVTGGFEEVRKTDQVGGSFYGAGFLTALKPGNATVTAWPCRMAYDAKTGKAVKEKIKDAKPASVKITVTDVEAVKSVKVTPHDTGAAFTYKMPANGFRREVYVLPGKAKPADFENKISAVKNGDHSAFTYVRLGYTEISFDKASGKYVKAVPGNEVLRDGDNLPLTLGNLKPDSQYTLYIRNVSGIRNIDGSRSGNALADSGALHAEGIEVSSLVTEEGALQSLTENPSESASGDDGELQEAGAGTSLVVSSVAGSVKTFKTGKEEPSGIGLSVNALDREDANEDNTQFMVKLSKKNVQIDAFGYFEDTSEGADDGDVITKPIPLKGPEAKAYGKQKLSFAVIDEGAKELPANTEPRKSDRKLYACYTDGNGDKFWYEKSRIAKISNKGKLTLLGQGLVKIICIDAVSGEQGEIKAFIDADPDSVAVGKKAAKDLVLQPGESMWLSSVLEYKEGKTAVAAYQGYTRTIGDDSSYIHMYADLAVYDESDEIKLYSDTTLSDEYYSIERKTINNIPYWNASAHEVGQREYHDYRIKALKSGGTKTLNVTDSLAGTVTVNLSEAPIEPVKQITAAWKDPVTGENVGIIRDNDIYGFFTHSAKGVDAAPESSYSGTLKARVSLYDMTHRNPLYSEVQEHTPLCFDAKKKVWVYCWGWTGLTSSQQYRVGIRVLNSDGSEASEEKIFKFKTTDIPASHADLSLAFLGYVDGEFGYTRLDEHTGGVDYNISEGAVYFDREDASTKLSSLPVLTSGNTYTLTPVLGDGDCDTELLEKRPLEPGEKWDGGLAFSTVNTASCGRSSDKLVWKVSDKKVLKVKPKAGTYNAALTALKPGTAEITVSSKITKKVIMRRTVTVGAVAGGDAFFGENEPYNRSYNWGYSYETPEDTTVENDILEITLDNPIRVQLEPYSNRWFVFEAPAYGRYTFRIGTSDLSGKVELEKGQKYYLRLSGREYGGTYYLSVEGEIFEPVSGDSFIVTAGSETATLFSPTDEENYYIFSFVNDKGETRYLTGFTSVAGALSDSHRFIADKVSKMETGFGLRRGDVLQIILDDNYMGITKGKIYRFIVTKCSVKDSLTLGEELAFSMTEPAEAEQWFSFTAPEEGVYTFKRKDTEGSAKLSWSYAFSFMDDETRGKNKGTVINEEPDPDIDLPIEKGTYVCALDKGEMIYLILKAESPGPENPGRGMLSVSFAPVIPVELDGETLTIDVKPGECFYYSITGDEEEEYLQYILNFENGSGQTIQSSDTLKGYFNGHCYSRFTPAPDWSFINDLKKGESFYLRVWNDRDAELKGARIFARHSRVNLLTEKETEGELTRSVFNHGEAYYAFDVPKKKEAGIYRFTFKGTPGLTVSVRKGIGENGELLAGPKNLTEGNDTIVYETDEPLTEFSRYYYTVCTDLGGVVSGKAEEVSFTPLELGENKDLSSKYVCFAAEENEVYDIRFFTEGFGIGVIELGSEFFQFNERYDKIENESMSWLTKRDGKIYFKVVLDGGKKYSVTVKKRNAVKLDSGVKYYRIPDDEFGEWFCFQPPDDGRIDYAFYFDSIRDFRYYAFLGDTLDEGTGYVLVGNNIKIRSGISQETEAARLNQGMAQGKPVYFWIRYSDEIPTITDITISVFKG